MTELDIDFVRLQFPAFCTPDQAFFEMPVVPIPVVR